jgi:hypothetical protein
LICYEGGQFLLNKELKEIEEGLKREFIETLQDPEEIQHLTSNVTSSAFEIIDILFSLQTISKDMKRKG